jgi:hypothetical protein
MHMTAMFISRGAVSRTSDGATSHAAAHELARMSVVNLQPAAPRKRRALVSCTTSSRVFSAI